MMFFIVQGSLQILQWSQANYNWSASLSRIYHKQQECFHGSDNDSTNNVIIHIANKRMNLLLPFKTVKYNWKS